MRCVLITGASGYVGGRLTEHLALKNMEIRAGSRSERASASGCRWVRMDFDSRESIRTACHDVDAVVHLASCNEIASEDDPEAATMVNTLYTQRLFDAARDAGVGRFLYFSTVHVYGNPLPDLIRETTVADPRHPYSISHKAAEDYLAYGARKHGMTVDIVRMTNAFGYPAGKETDRWSLVVNDACRQLAGTGTVQLRSAGTQRRDFITLTDVCNAVHLLLETPGTEDGDRCRIFNLGGEYSPTIFEIVTKTARLYDSLTGRHAEIRRPDPGPTAIRDLCVDIGKIRSLGFAPCRNHDEEILELLRRCLQWFPREDCA